MVFSQIGICCRHIIIIYIILYVTAGPVIAAVLIVYDWTKIIIGETLVKYKLKTVHIPNDTASAQTSEQNFLCVDQRHVTTTIIIARIRCVFTLSPSVFGTTHTHMM